MRLRKDGLSDTPSAPPVAITKRKKKRQKEGTNHGDSEAPIIATCPSSGSKCSPSHETPQKASPKKLRMAQSILRSPTMKAIVGIMGGKNKKTENSVAWIGITEKPTMQDVSDGQDKFGSNQTERQNQDEEDDQSGKEENSMEKPTMQDISDGQKQGDEGNQSYNEENTNSLPIAISGGGVPSPPSGGGGSYDQAEADELMDTSDIRDDTSIRSVNSFASPGQLDILDAIHPEQTENQEDKGVEITIPSTMNQQGRQRVEQEIKKRRSRGKKLYGAVEVFGDIKGGNSRKKSKTVYKTVWQWFKMVRPGPTDRHGRSTESWPQLAPVIAYVDNIVDPPQNGAPWPHPSEGKAKRRIVFGVPDEATKDVLKASLEAAVQSNWTTNDAIDIAFHYTEEDMFVAWRRTGHDNRVSASSPGARRAVTRLLNTPSARMLSEDSDEETPHFEN